MREACVANIDNILTVPRHRLRWLMGAFASAKVEKLDEAVKTALGVR